MNGDSGQQSHPEDRLRVAKVAVTVAEAIVPPTVRPIRVDIRRGLFGPVRLITIACPYCSRTHTHGWPPDVPGQPFSNDDHPGHRLAHCSTGEGGDDHLGYVIVSGAEGVAR